MRKTIFMIPLLALLSGCANWVTFSEEHPAAEVAGKASLQYLTLKYIGQQPNPSASAGRIKSAADSAIALLNDQDELALNEIEAAVIAQIDFTKMKPEDAALIRALISAVKLELAAAVGKIEAGDPAAKMASAKVIGWISEAASWYAPKAVRIDEGAPMLVGGMWLPQIKIAIIP